MALPRRFVVVQPQSVRILQRVVVVVQHVILLAADLGYLTEESHSGMHACVVDVKRMLSGLLRRLIVDGRGSSS